MFTIMFVCTGNTCRSPMAEGALKKLLKNNQIENIRVISSGTAAATGYPATAFAVEAARIWDADILSHASQPLTAELIKQSDLILALSSSHCYETSRLDPSAAPKTFLLKNFPNPGCGGDGVDDPIGRPLDVYNQTFLEIGEELGRILPHIIETAQNWAENE